MGLLLVREQQYRRGSKKIGLLEAYASFALIASLCPRLRGTFS